MAGIAQNEYYFMARQNGCYPTWKLGTLGSLAMYIAACSENPVVRDALFPLTGTMTIVYLLLRQEPKTPPTTMNDVATTFMGIYYFGYMPSFWIRLRCLGPMAPARVIGLFASEKAMRWWPIAKIASVGADLFTYGALIQWWTMVSIVAADVFAYFTGKRFGRTQLISVSPNKTWEGLIGGCSAAVLLSVCGALLMRWPLPVLSGAVYGLGCAVMALIGDLTVSLLKRSAGVKDTGQLLPGHGGLLDRLDSYLLVAAPAYFFVRFLIFLGRNL
uniref:Phosphatidate cytidylyltransferase n=1 Tax=Calcidiscus leptoporus TaxID=127549 RepID=A0A7S0ISI3_9EUKA